MFFLTLFLVVLLKFVISDDCVTYDFENDFEELFTHNFGVCDGMESWSLGSYSIYLESPDPKSTTFISPAASISCVTSFEFPLTVGGIVEVNVYMESASNSDQLTILALHASNGNHPTVGTYVIMPTNPTFVNGWHTARMQLTGTGTYTGYIALMGTASTDSIVLIDSFRYISPTQNEDSCIIYEGIETTTETPSTTTEMTTTTTETPSTTTEMTTTTTETPSTTTESDAEPTTSTETSLHTEATSTSTTLTQSTTTVSSTTTETPDKDLEYSFWNPLTITMTVLLSLIFLALIYLIFYILGKRRAKTEVRHSVFTDSLSVSDNMSIPHLVPRVKGTNSEISKVFNKIQV